MVVPVLLRDRTRPGRVQPARHKLILADRLAQLELRRRHLRSQRRLLTTRSRRDRDPQHRWRLGSSRRRGGQIRGAGAAARPRSSDRRADHHPGKATPMAPHIPTELLYRQVLGHLFAPDHRGRRRAQPSQEAPERSPTPSSRSPPPSEGAVHAGNHRPPRSPSCSSTAPSPTRRAGTASSSAARRPASRAAAPNPLRGISHDSAYVASFIKQVPGPVLAVGHSYGGAVISNTATGLGNVVGLVFVAAFAPAEGERLGDVESGSHDSILMSAWSRASIQPVRARRRRLSSQSVRKFRDAFAADLPPAQTAVMAAQRPVAELAFRSHRARPPGSPRPPGPWSPPAAERPTRTWSGPWPSAPAPPSPRSRARTSIMVSQPGAVADVILTAAAAVTRPAAAGG